MTWRDNGREPGGEREERRQKDRPTRSAQLQGGPQTRFGVDVPIPSRKSVAQLAVWMSHGRWTGGYCFHSLFISPSTSADNLLPTQCVCMYVYAHVYMLPQDEVQRPLGPVRTVGLCTSLLRVQSENTRLSGIPTEIHLLTGLEAGSPRSW